MKKDAVKNVGWVFTCVFMFLLATYSWKQVVSPSIKELFRSNTVHEIKPEEFSLDSRPKKASLLMDYAGLLGHQTEGVNNYLQRIRDNYGIEMMIVTRKTISDTDARGDINKAAFKLFNGWDIGRDYSGRGVLLLVVLDSQQAKIENSQNVEDVFTDLFSGFVTDKQLDYYLKNDDLGLGLVAIMEEFERRAQIKNHGQYTPESISEIDRRYISMGAGIVRDIDAKKQQKEKPDTSYDGKYSKGAQTPEEAWQIIVSKWNGEGRFKDVDIYTEASKLISGDQDNNKYSWARPYKNMHYRIIRNGDYAIVSFGRKKGWDNSPVFLMRTSNPDGWKVDFTSQRKYVVMGPSPDWMIEIADHPYLDLASYAWTSMGKDIPVGAAKYNAGTDAVMAHRYATLRKAFASDRKNFDLALEIGALGTLMALPPKDIHPYLDAAKKLNPKSPLPYKYMAINYVESNYQYRSAISEVKEFAKRGGNPVFANNFMGFLYMRSGNYGLAIQYLNDALRNAFSKGKYNAEIEKQVMYSYEKLYRCYVKMDMRKEATEMYRMMKELSPNDMRVILLGVE